MTKHSHLPPILFEDEHLIAFDKPGGLLTAPDRWDAERPCLTNIIHAELGPEIFNAHRLDADTSGVLLCAKTRAALTALCRQFETRQVEKRYLSIVLRAPPADSQTVAQMIEENPERPGTMRVVPGVQEGCVTAIVVKQRWRHYSLVEAVPHTGKTHQIRVHLAHLGCPVVADRIYGNGHGIMLSALKRNYKQKAVPERPLIGRLALHAANLSFLHPVSGARLSISAPLPKDFRVAIKYLDKFAAPRWGIEG